MFSHDDARQVVLALTQQVQVFEQHAGTADWRGVGPTGEGGLGSGDGFGDGLAAGQGHAAGFLAGGRVVDVLIAVITGHALVVVVVLDRCCHGSESQVLNVGSHDRLSICSEPEQNPELIVHICEQYTHGKD
ncbi:hypothetical protein PS896_05822 [Pseudomonas fluorescens]|uniref:Uncharacterized protein n=1 Tax=Pseudomonas fluorescens TaxID=294 RepID=A0A5E7Q7K3_PSEFL|nr:hypothetical protein PS896_05822 [Pseudomonas fluorescens]